MNADPIRRPMLGAAYYPEAWEEKEQAHDIAMMQKAGINVVRIGEFAWHNMEPREGGGSIFIIRMPLAAEGGEWG